MHTLSISDLHIILVEPSDTQSKIIKALLLREDVQAVDVVKTVNDAKEALQAHSADLVVSTM